MGVVGGRLMGLNNERMIIIKGEEKIIKKKIVLFKISKNYKI